MALGWLVEETGAHVPLSSITSIGRKNAKEENPLNQHMAQRQVHLWNFVFLNHGDVYMAQGLLEADRIHLSKGRKRL